MKIQFLSLAGIDLPTSTIPLFADHCVAGFPTPAQDYIEQSLDLNDYCVPHPVSTFYLIAQGEYMVQAGILSGDLLVVDKSLQAKHGDILIAALDGEFTVKQLCTRPTDMTNFICSYCEPGVMDCEPEKDKSELIIT